MVSLPRINSGDLPGDEPTTGGDARIVCPALSPVENST